MPGTVTTVNVGVGQIVSRGDVLVTIEAMKMETSVRAERDGVVSEVVARPGEHVEAKDLLVVMKAVQRDEGDSE
jgi:pyruvate carboxylase